MDHNHVLPSRVKDITGQRFGRLQVLEFVGTFKRIGSGVVSKASKWRCKCDCGRVIEIFRSNLVDGGTKSCGCLIHEQADRRRPNRKPFGESAAHDVYCFYKNHARKAKRTFDLNEPDFRRLIIMPCNYCGRVLTNERKSPRGNGGFKYTGLDRIDSTKGYTVNNIVPCCSYCNFMKRHFTVSEFLSHVRKIYEHSADKCGKVG